jgi:hypothetical protein
MKTNAPLHDPRSRELKIPHSRAAVAEYLQHSALELAARTILKRGSIAVLARGGLSRRSREVRRLPRGGGRGYGACVRTRESL